MEHLELGASLYLPATRSDLYAIGTGDKIPGLRSVIFCTEDAVAEDDLPAAMRSLETALRGFARVEATPDAPIRFVRARSPEILQQVLRMDGVQSLRGFVLPKFSLTSMETWLRILSEHPRFVCMPTLETADTFDPEAMRRLRDALSASPQRRQVAVLRIGGLDLLQLLGIRRQCSRTIYDTALRHCLQQLAGIFLPADFVLSAPVFECMGHYDVLRDEVEMDLLNGFYLKSAIHPEQVSVIHNAYRVRRMDWEVAGALLDPATPAVFRMDDRMCEKATHGSWARRLLRQAELYGIA